MNDLIRNMQFRILRIKIIFLGLIIDIHGSVLNYLFRCIENVEKRNEELKKGR